MNTWKSRYSILFAFSAFFLIASFILRSIFFLLNFAEAGISFLASFKIFGLGFLFDLAVVCFIGVAYSVYLLLLPQRLNRHWLNRGFTYFFFFLTLLLVIFSFFGEVTFWMEFESRYNFIAVDYLVYTYEVIHNINESYPLPWLISGMLLSCLAITVIFVKKKIFANSFSSVTPFRQRLLLTGSITGLALGLGLFLRNDIAEQSYNHYQNELTKAGIFSFFAAFKNNELNYEQFYRVENIDEAFALVRKDLAEPGARFADSGRSVSRFISHQGEARKPNVIMVTIESFSADFMQAFGNKQQLTPVLDSLAAHSLLFTNMYATGTRTVRGMEALSLAVPPTPGSSIVRRPGTENLTTIGNIFREAGYARAFLYGGDGYFDNMNEYFGNNGYAIVDKGRNMVVKDKLKTTRHQIPDSMIHFKNAWGICDEDLYDEVIEEADSQYNAGSLFYDFVMTTSNHRPYTFPEGKISFASGSGREGAVRYTDYAIGAFLEKAAKKPWFQNTIFIFVADHCASSAGKNEIDISKYHIPAIVYDPMNSTPRRIESTCSQIDLYPTLFAWLRWSYQSNLFGKDVLAPGYQERALLGTYQKLALLKADSVVILGPQQKVETYLYNKTANTQAPIPAAANLVNNAVAFYQTTYYLFKNNGLRQDYVHVGVVH